MPEKKRLPSNATLEEQRQHYEPELKRLGEQIKNDFERECAKCGSMNPCTGVDRCGQCGKSLKNAKRIPSSERFNPSKY